jgi:hypothetical protein
MASALIFFEGYNKGGHEFLNLVIRVIGAETWVSFVNVETNEQSRQWMHTRLPKMSKKFTQTLSGRKLMETVFWGRKGVLMVEFMQQGTTLTSEMYSETLKNCVRPFRTKSVEC